MAGEGPAAGLVAGPLARRIELLKLEEQGARLRRDWSTASGIARQRAVLKQAHHRALARNHGGGTGK
jgi:hypothetical protein